jgi:hypothetical protein
VIAIENKIDSGEGKGQLERYREIVAENFNNVPSMYVYLTTDASDASEEDWVPYSYADVHRVLTRVRHTNASAIGDDVLAFLDHYLRLIGSRFMEDPEIDVLCKKIYQNHRQAIDLILDRVVTPGAGLIGAVGSAMKTDDRWEVVRETGKTLSLFPKDWRASLPAVGKRKTFDPVHWIVLDVYVGRRQCSTMLRVWPTTDSTLRKDCILRLIRDPKEFRLKSMFKDQSKIGDDWASLGRESVSTWDEDEGPDIESVVPKVVESVGRRFMDLSGVPNALRPIFDRWNSTTRQ